MVRLPLRIDRAWPLASGRNSVIADIDWGTAPPIRSCRPASIWVTPSTPSTGYQRVDRRIGLPWHRGDGHRGRSGQRPRDGGCRIRRDSLAPASGRARDGARGERVGESDRLGPNDRWWRVAQDHQSRGADRHVRNYEMVPSVNAAIRTAIANGVVVCVAAGNGDRMPGWMTPGTRSRRRIHPGRRNGIRPDGESSSRFQ